MVSKKNSSQGKRALLEQMQSLAKARVNDAVKLAYLSEEQVDLIDDLDLTALTEFKRSGNGAVEVKFTDRMKAMEQIMSALEVSGKERDEAGLEQFFKTLGGEES